jgi:hypothetical protein
MELSRLTSVVSHKLESYAAQYKQECLKLIRENLIRMKTAACSPAVQLRPRNRSLCPKPGLSCRAWRCEMAAAPASAIPASMD